MSLASRAETIYRQRVAHADALRTRATSLVTPDPALNLGLEWAKVNLDEQLQPRSRLRSSGRMGTVGARACALDSAGSSAGTNSLAMSVQSRTRRPGPAIPRELQQDDGKVTHEKYRRRQAASRGSRISLRLTHAGHDAVLEEPCGGRVRATGDRAFLQELSAPRRRPSRGARGTSSRRRHGRARASKSATSGTTCGHVPGLRVDRVAGRDAATGDTVGTRGRPATSGGAARPPRWTRSIWLPAAGHHALGLVKSAARTTR